jgi:WD40 repeat protein
LWSGSYDSHARRWRVADGALELTVGHHSGTVASVAFSADGAHLASGSHDFTGRIWDTATGTEQHALIGHMDVVNSIAWSENMSQVATASGSPPPDTRDTTIKIWNPSTGALIRTLQGHLFGSTAVDYTPDNQFLISGGRDKQVKYWRQSDGLLVRRLFLPGPIDALQVSPNGAVLAVAVNDGVSTFDVATGAQLRTIPAGAQVVGLDWSPDNHTVALALPRTRQREDLRNPAGRTGANLRGDPLGFEQAVAYSADGQTLYSGSGYTYSIQAWRVGDGTLLATYDREAGWGLFPTMAIDVHPNGSYFLYGRNDATVVLARPEGITAVSPPSGFDAPLRLSITPNPVQKSAAITFLLPRPARVELRILDVGGRVVRTLIHGPLEMGSHTVQWDGAEQGVRAGIYFVELRAEGRFVSRRKIALLQ